MFNDIINIKMFDQNKTMIDIRSHTKIFLFITLDM